jgi:lipoate-protein ligase A
VAGGAENMADDEALLETALEGLASLRFYGWREPTVSLGYFQPERVRLEDPLLAELPWVRRPSGGATLVHHHEVTYALALPPGPPWQPSLAGQFWLTRMHEIIAAALADLGVAARLHVLTPGQEYPGFLCFRHFAAGDLLIGNAKVVGSAQRRQKGALLQHGGILLEQSLYTPSLPGIRELTGKRLAPAEVCAAVVERFRRATGWEVTPRGWTAAERAATARLAAEKYRSDEWNSKR